MTFKLALVQMAPVPTSDQNLKDAVRLIHQAADAGAEVICLPELFMTPYFCQTEDHQHFDLAEPIPGPTTSVLSEIAASRQVVIIASLFERRAAGIYHNTSVVLDTDGRMSGIYRKTHIPDDPGFYEKFYFTPGDVAARVFDTFYGRIGVLICWDQWFPEAARLLTLKGAEIILYPTAIGWHPQEKEQFGAAQLNAWQTVQRGHAIANGTYVAAVNRCGFEPRTVGTPDHTGIEFWGHSFVADPQGQFIAQAQLDTNRILYADIDSRYSEQIRQHWPFLRDRRIDLYRDISARYLGEDV